MSASGANDSDGMVWQKGVTWLDGVPIPGPMSQLGVVTETAVLVIGYMNAEGQSRYAIRVGGDRTLASYIGLLALAQHTLIVQAAGLKDPGVGT